VVLSTKYYYDNETEAVEVVGQAQEDVNVYKNLIGKPEGRRPFGSK
jgi:hypothetical protein